MDRTMIPQIPQLSIQHLKAYDETWARKFNEAIHDRELRKWCIEMSLKINTETNDLLAVARQIHEFVTEPLRKTDGPNC